MMRNVKPIDLEAAIAAAHEDNVPQLSATTFVKEHLDRQLQEVDALVSLLGIARKQPGGSRDCYGYDVDHLDEIVLRRVRKLVRACTEAVSAAQEYHPDEMPKPETFEWGD